MIGIRCWFGLVYNNVWQMVRYLSKYWISFGPILQQMIFPGNPTSTFIEISKILRLQMWKCECEKNTCKTLLWPLFGHMVAMESLCRFWIFLDFPEISYVAKLAQNLFNIYRGTWPLVKHCYTPNQIHTLCLSPPQTVLRLVHLQQSYRQSKLTHYLWNTLYFEDIQYLTEGFSD